MERSEPTTRRVLLRASGLGGLALAGTALALSPTPAASAAPTEPGTGATPLSPGLDAVFHVPTVAALLGLDPKQVDDGQLVHVDGHHAAGDGGARLVRWAAISTATANGGTVLSPYGDRPGTGRWLQVHDGVVEFRHFGIFDPTTPADAALDAMVNDPTVHRIEAHSDLHFVKRHRFTRSDLVLDFGGHTMSTKGIEDAGRDDPFAAVLFFRGTVTDQVHTHKLTEVVREGWDSFQVGDSSAFAVGQWYAVEVNQLAGRWEKELQKLVQVTQIVDGTHIRINYKNGWELAAGRTLTWTRVEPVSRVHVHNLVFTGNGGDQYTGSHPLAYEYAVHCDATDIDATGSFWPVIMRRWATYFHTARCTLTNPTSVTWGGAGYLTQQIYCLYGHVEDCRTSNARHLNDWTASAYCYVTNCHGDGDDQGPFVTHGQYEHDLVYTGNSGLMTFANSGAAWGSAAKRITVRKHVCSWFVARVKVTDLTLEDVQVIRKDGLAGSGMIWVNADGIQMRGCSADDTLIISQASSRSGRPNTIEGCTFRLATRATSVVQANVTVPVHLVRTTITGLDGHTFDGTGALHLTDVTLTGAAGAAPIVVKAAETRISGGTLTDTGIRLAGTADQRLTVGGGAVLRGTNAAKALLSRGAATGTVRWELGGYLSVAADADTAHVVVESGRNRYSAVGTQFSGGRLRLTDAGFGEGSYLHHTGCVEEDVDRTLPAAGPRIRDAGNLTV
ncbi:peptidase C14 [Micromonospora sagamiensis]|uniref:Peptidase C14 n=1 Tax=Micromonospora sagamiensis TaxID=47875 RepID=A0A562WHL8_9ACTN|nr:peptidase C14 [Micromonospora sagamiensis]TWJ29377.1 hypothetical protein JD81_02887 [Micromonospora sagamiensis]BCL17595.1 hypothetical protein GCM10017556_53340 [Micromonospora sagamiensis]